MYNTCLKHIPTDIHTYALHAHMDVCVWSPQTYPHCYIHTQPSNTPCKHTQTHVCTAFKTWMPTHIPLKHTHTEIDAHALCLLFRAAPVTFPSTRVHSQLLLLDLKMWGTWWSVSLSTFPINIPFRGWQHLVTFLLQKPIKGAWLPPVWGCNDVSRNFSLAPALGPCSRDKKSLYECVWGGEVWTWGCK